MSVAGLAIDASTRNPIVLLLDPSKRRQVPIWIDHAQAHHILSGIKDLQETTPLSHDLMLSLMELGELKLEKVIIHSIEDNTFHAVLKILKRQKDEQEESNIKLNSIEMNARPSDAIALAVRSKCTIWMLEEVVSKASIPVDIEADEEDKNEFKKFLDEISPASLINHFQENDKETS